MAKDESEWFDFKETTTILNIEMIKDILTNVCNEYIKEMFIGYTAKVTSEDRAKQIEDDFFNKYIPGALNLLTNQELRILFAISDHYNHSIFNPNKEYEEFPKVNIFNAGHILLYNFYDGVLGQNPTKELRENINNFFIRAWLNTTLQMYDLEVTKEIRESFNNKSDIFTQIKAKGLFKDNKKLYNDLFTFEKENAITQLTGQGKITRKELKTLTAETKVVTNISKKTNLDLDLQLFSNKDFIKILQGNGTNALMKIKTTSTLEGQIDFMGAATFEADNDFKLIIKDYAEGIPTHAWKLLDCFMIVFTQTKNPSIKLPLKDYMAMRGLKDPKSARIQVLESMNALSKIIYGATEKINGRRVHSGTISLFGGSKFIKNGIINFNFNTDFYGQLLNYKVYKVMDYPPGVLKTNDKEHPNAFYFYRFIVENYRMNEGKERVSFINVKTLMSKSPKMLTYEEVMSSNRNIKDRIIKPFIKDLDSLENVYCDIVAEDKKTIIDNVEDLTYSQFIKCYVKIDYTDYPRNIKRLDRKRKHQEAIRKKTAKNKEYPKRTTKKLN